MGLYGRFVLPWVLHLAMQSEDIARLRGTALPQARGRTLEIGIGSGLNLPFYGDEVETVIGVEPLAALRRLARSRAADASFAVDVVDGDAQALSFDAASFDTVVTTWTMCSIPDPDLALREAHRVLRPDGRLLFIEHGRSPDSGVQRWQDRLTPVWRACAGGCHLNRDISGLIAGAGFDIRDIDTGYLVRGPRFATWQYKGLAVPA